MKVIYNDEKGNEIVEYYDGVELISTTINNMDEDNYNPNEIESAKLTNIKSINTAWARFSFGVDPWGHIWGSHCGYETGCIWTEWSPYADDSVEEACKRTVDFYGPKK